MFSMDLGSRECGGHVVVALYGELDGLRQCPRQVSGRTRASTQWHAATRCGAQGRGW